MPRVVSSDLATAVAALPPTAVDTSDALQAAVSSRLSTSEKMILVISDQVLHRHDPRIIQISPETMPQDIAISTFSARATPRPEVMVRIRNETSQTSAPLIVRSGSQRQTRQIDLPPRGNERDYFVDMPQLGDTVEATLDVRDDISADNRVWLVRKRSWPRIAIRDSIGPELGRMIDVYESHHAPSNASPTLAIASRLNDLPAAGPAVFVAPAILPPIPSAIQIVDHPITRHINWDTLAPSLSWNADAPDGWQPLVSVGGHTLVAARDKSSRQVWVGIGGTHWPASAEFVVFWANVFDWAGQGDERFFARGLQELTAEWRPTDASSGSAWGQPGIYKNGSQRCAFNAAVPELTPPPQTNWREGADGLESGSRRHDSRGAIGDFSCIILSHRQRIDVAPIPQRRS